MEKSSYGYAELGRAPSYDSEISSLESSTTTRRLPLVNILGKRGFFLFTSKQSYDKFRITKFKDVKLDADGVGVPLFHMVTKYDITAHVSAKKPIYVIYKYVVKELQSPPPYTHSEVVLQVDSYCLYKVPFCEIYKCRGFTETSYKLLFPFEPESAKEYKMVEDSFSMGFEVKFGGNSLVWDVTAQKNHALCYDLRVEDTSTVENNLTSGTLPVNGPNCTIGNYNPKLFGRIPMSTYNCANLLFNEKSGPAAFGITSVPYVTELLACQGMLIHRIDEDRR
ncbi:hypothetical protein ZYGM_000052 [Zygosaccharomyces mellis]|uniref:Uncharacterized protein n=1 Tax=Zygosaccharomyces mellis TaxID=42258 RepID=A0A4C2EC01_9SACH|nr:hypothetical protein ZYGM_000052 [Zygosaccharomyces mellis]